MRLSEAILLGSVITKQCYGLFSSQVGQELYACALGAAGVAMGKIGYAQIESKYPWLERMFSCPACRVAGNAEALIFHLNDVHHWTREHTAEWVAKVEPSEPDSPALDRPQAEVSGQAPSQRKCPAESEA